MNSAPEGPKSVHLAILPVALVIITVVKVLVRKNIVAKPEKKKNPNNNPKINIEIFATFYFCRNLSIIILKIYNQPILESILKRPGVHPSIWPF